MTTPNEKLGQLPKATDYGIGEHSYDYEQGFREAIEMLKSCEWGKRLIWNGTGNQAMRDCFAEWLEEQGKTRGILK